MIFRIFLSITLFFSILSKAQNFTADQLIEAWSDSSDMQAISYHKTEQDLYRNFNKTKSEALSEQLQDYLQENPDKRLFARITMYVEAIRFRQGLPASKEGKRDLERAIRVAKEFNDRFLLSELTAVYYEKEFHSHATTLYYEVKAAEFQQKIGEKHFPSLYKRYYHLADHYYLLGEYNISLEYSKKVLSILERDISVDYWQYLFALDLVGANYNDSNRPKEAMVYYQKLNKIGSDYYKQRWVSKNSFPFVGSYHFDWSIVAKGGLGKSLMLQNKDDLAKPLLLESYKGSLEQKLDHNQTKVLNLLGEIEFRAKNYDASLEYFKKALDVAVFCQAKRNEIVALEGLYKNYNKLGKYNFAVDYQTQYYAKLKIEEETENVIKYFTIKSRLKNDSLRVVNKEAGHKIEIVNTQRNVIIALSIMAIIVLTIVYKNYSTRLKLSIFKSESIRKHREFQLKRSMQEKNEAVVQLEHFKNKLAQNSKIIKAIDNKGYVSEELKSLQQSTILTNEEWDNFKKQFSKVFPSFILRLKEEYPQFSNAEVRYLCLVKLNLSTSEVASALGVSPSSLRVTWYRIRKKIDIPDQVQPLEFIENYVEMSTL